jgi:hypothetical protein
VPTHCGLTFPTGGACGGSIEEEKEELPRVTRGRYTKRNFVPELSLKLIHIVISWQKKITVIFFLLSEAFVKFNNLSFFGIF